MKEKFAHYNLELEEVLIGTPSSPEGDTQIETILMQLRSRQIAEEQVETYAQQEKAAVKERELREAQSRAQMQTKMTEAELNINIQSDQGKAEYQRSIQQAQQIRALAEAEAEKDRPHRYCAGACHRRTSPRVWRAAVPGDPAGAAPALRKPSSNRAWTLCRAS
jgi:uncharacterized membrane protein YqiK